VAPRAEATVAGKFRRPNRGANVIDLFAGGEGAVKRDADHWCSGWPFCITKRRADIEKRDAFSITSCSALSIFFKTELNGRQVSNSLHSRKSPLVVRFIRRQIIMAKASKLKARDGSPLYEGL
jgi:hypothetical protein